MCVCMVYVCECMHAYIFIIVHLFLNQKSWVNQYMSTSAMWVGPYTIGGRKGGAMEQQSHLILRVLCRILIFTEGTN